MRLLSRLEDERKSGAIWYKISRQSPKTPLMTATNPRSESRAHRATLTGYAFTVFISSALLLVLEIVAGRLVAPYVGVSLYTWTSIIGVILAGLSLGNWLGGVWADRSGDSRNVGLVLGLSGIFCILCLPALDWLGELIQASEVGLLGASFLFAAALFFVPAALIGVVAPLLTTLALRLDPHAGHVVGRMHALAAIGSIAGTFTAGYWLVQSFGTRSVLLGTAVSLILLAAPFLRRAGPLIPAVLVIGTLSSGALLWVRQGLATPCTRESSYFCIRVVDHSADAPFGEARGLVLDHLLHGINHARVPQMLIAPYVQAIDELTYAHFRDRYDKGLSYFFAGGGAYSQPRAVKALSPNSQITVAELDPLVTLTAIEHLFLRPEGMRIVHQDARLAMIREPGLFDVVVGDVFHDIAIPFHLVTREFAALVKSKLSPGGLYAMNVVDAFPDPRLIKSMVKTLREEFAFVDVWMEGMPEHPRVTFVLTVSNGSRLPEKVAARGGFERTWHRVTDKLMEIGTAPDNLPMLTDDYSPVERLIAGLLVGE
jgi:MFS family permease